MAEQRQLTGVLATINDPRPEGFTVYKAVTGIDQEGVITQSGLVTVPLSSARVLRGSLDSENPSLVGPRIDLPQQPGETKEASQQGSTPINPLWFALGALLLL
jgi:hypothetical protein